MALRHLHETALTPMRVSVDGRVVAKDAVIVTVANVETYGPWLNLTPGASPIDGLLDVFVMRRSSKREILGRLLKRQLRLLATDPGALVVRGRRVSIVAPPNVRDELDLMPRRLPVLVSSETAEALARDLTRAGGFSPDGRRRVA
jgi:diacylglycerol kinase family enzyme